MSNKYVELVENLIEETERLNYKESEKIERLQIKIAQALSTVFGVQSEYVSDVKAVVFRPTKSFYLEMSKQTYQDSWELGKLKLLEILRITLEDTKSLLRITPLKTTSTDRELTLKNLNDILTKIDKKAENEFLREAIKCYEVGAWRASIIMVWNFTIDHLFEHILVNELPTFNNALANNNDKRIKIKSILRKDDFSEIPENKFIEFCRASKIISKDVRKILDTKLGIRNTYAHPSNVTLKESKVIDFIEDLINNVVLKFSLP